jgi:hypothetical protein
VTVLAALAVAGAVASGWCTHRLSHMRPTATGTSFVGVTVDRGCYEYEWCRYVGAIAFGAPPGWYFENINVYAVAPLPRWQWLRFDWATNTYPPSGTREFTAAIPAWLPPVLLLAVTAFAWRGSLRRARRRRAGCCAACNYDRRGLPATTACPECGTQGSAVEGKGSSPQRHGEG